MMDAITIKSAADSIREMSQTCASKSIDAAFLQRVMRSGAIVTASEIELRVLALGKGTLKLSDVLDILDAQKKDIDALKAGE